MKITRWFRNRPIHVKLGLINVVVVAFALLPVVTLTVAYEYVSVRNSMLREAEVQADIIRDNIAAATAFGDAESAQEILRALRSSPNVVQAALLQPDGSLLASYAVPGQAPRPLVKGNEDDGSSADWEAIRVTRLVSLKENPVGWLAIETSMQPLHERLGLYLAVCLVSTVLGFAIAYPLSKKLKESITGPLSELMALTKHVTTHRDYTGSRRIIDSTDEIGSLSRAFDNMLSRIRERDLQLSQMAYYDNVTGLHNRHYFMERLEQAVGNSRRYGKRCCLMFIDLDNFKAINDTCGHHIGDELLREVARHLTNVLRESDVVCRLGGDEFAVIVENVGDMAGPGVMARKIIERLSTPMHLQGSDVKIGASIGISACPDFATNMTELLHTADEAMYWAKEHGKNCYRVYTLS